MSTPQQQIETDLRSALKAGEKERLGTLRMLLTEIKNERIRRGEEVDQATFYSLVQKAIRRRQEAAEQFRKGNRPELAEKEEREAVILEGYLPEPASEGELRTAIAAFVQERELSGPGGIGPVMQEMMARFSGRAEGATIQRIAREILGGSS